MKPIIIGGTVLAIVFVAADFDSWQRVVAEQGAAKAGKKDIRKLQVKLPEGWKDDGTIFDERRFIKGPMIIFFALSKAKVPAKAEELADMAKKNDALLPGRTWVKTTGIGKLPDGVFIVGVGKAMGSEHNAVAGARTIDGQTVLFLGTPADDAAARKAFLELAKSAKFVDK